MPTGTVKFYNDDKGYGFIARDDGQGDIFVHIKNVDEQLDPFEKGQRVTFEEGVDRNAKAEARNVRAAPSAEQ